MKLTNALLILVLLLCGAIGYYSYKTSEEVKALRAQLQVAELKVDSLMIATANLAQSTKKATTKKQQPQKSFWEELFTALEKDSQQSTTKSVKTPQLAVTSSYRLEDRYVSGQVRLPEYVGDEEGKIVVNITVNRLGNVKKTSVGDGSTITDEEVIEASRKAALKTNFNYASDAREDMEGTITYTFKKQ